ncbi:unnamed protein product [Caenorhabditis brenneri]
MQSQLMWQDLPFRFKQGVVDKLDFKSRLSLQRCSWSDQNIVLTVPFFMSSMLLNLSPDLDDTPRESSDESDVSDDEIEVPSMKTAKTELLVMEKSFSKSLYWKTENEDETIETLKLILKNSTIGFRDMIFTKDGNPSRFIKLLLEKLENNLTFNVEKLTWTCIDIAKTPEEIGNCLKFFELFDSGTLRKLELNFSNKNFIGMLMNTGQFLNLQDIFINSEIDKSHLPLLFHSRRFKVKLDEVEAEQLGTVIKVFLKKPLGCYFKISTNETQIDLDSLLALFKTMPDNCDVPTNSYYERDTHTHRFDIKHRKSEKEEALVLFMKIRRNDLWGVVCRVEHIIKDFAVFPYY